MKRRAHYLFRARTHIRDIVFYLGQTSANPDLAYALARDLRGQCTRLAVLPGTLGRARPDLGPDLRSFPYRGYIIIFRYVDDGVEVAALIHASRDIAALFGGDEA